MNKIFAVVVALLFATCAYAQNAGTVTNHAYAIGKGPNVTGYTSLLCGSAQLAVGQAAADPICRTLSGDATLSAAGALTVTKTGGVAFGYFATGTDAANLTGTLNTLRLPSPFTSGTASGSTSKFVTTTGTLTNGNCVKIDASGNFIDNGTTCGGAGGGITQLTGDVTAGPGSGSQAATLATVNANVGTFGSATACVTVTNNAKGLTTAISAATCTPAIGSITGLGTGVATWLATPSSANLRAALTDETGTGLAYFQGGDIGTPSAGVGTNLTGTAAGLTAGHVTTNANLTGDVTSVGNATTLATVAAGGTFGSATSCVTITNNVKGLTTSISAATCTPAIGSITGLGTGVATALVNGVNTSGGVVTSPVANANLANSAIAVAGQTCTLGSTCGLANNSTFLTVDVNLTGSYVDGPVGSNGTTGAFLASGAVQIAGVTGGDDIVCRLWDGTTKFSSAQWTAPNGVGFTIPFPPVVVINPVANLKISCVNATGARGAMKASDAVNGNTASGITTIRVN